MIRRCEKCGDEFVAKFKDSKHKCHIGKRIDAAKYRAERKAKKEKKEPKKVIPTSEKEKNRDKRYIAIYGITLEQYNKMLIEQGGLCAICGNRDDKLVIDHNHSTGRVRGLLCGNCNTGLGMFQDNTELFKSAYTYLKADGLRYSI